MGGKVIPDAVKAEIVAMFTDGGMPPAEIGRQIAMNPIQVYRILNDAGLDTSSNGRGNAIKPETAATVIQRYLDRDDPRSICNEAKISISQMYTMLAEAGVKTWREQEREQRTQALEDAMKMYQDNIPVVDIVIATGISGYTINQEVHARGMSLRKPRINREFMPLQVREDGTTIPHPIPKRRGPKPRKERQVS